MRDIQANPQQDLDYQFTFASSDQVTGMQAVRGNHAYDLHLPSNATFFEGVNTVTEIVPGTASTQYITYTLEAGSTTLYDVTDVTTTLANPSTAHGAYAFRFNSSGAVTAELRVETEHGHAHAESVHLPPDAVFSVSSGYVTEQFVSGDEVDTITFAQSAGSTDYAVASFEKTYVQGGTATTRLDVDPTDRMQFTIDASGKVAPAHAFNGFSDAHRGDPNVSYTELTPDGAYVEEIVKHGAASSYGVFYEGQTTHGGYTEIAHGSGSTVDLAGLQAQVSQAESMLVKGATSTSGAGWII